MPSRSSKVSVGNPIMKYSFTLLHPPWKASDTFSIRSASVTPLLITSRRRWVPASGAKVRDDLRTFWVSSRDSFSTLSMRRDGRLMDTRFSDRRFISSRMSSGRQV